MEIIHSYRQLIVWQKALDLVTAVYSFVDGFPVQKYAGLAAQMRGAAISIPSNIAEGRRRPTRKDFVRFLYIAYASGAELETQLEITRRLSIGDPVLRTKAEALLDEVLRILNVMTARLQQSKKAQCRS